MMEVATFPIPFTRYGAAGPPLVFVHANGMPPACYRPLLERLAARYCIYAMHLRALWPHSRPEALRDWQQIARDLLAFLDQQGFTEPVYCAGHSVGATVTLRAALWAPQRFARIALLDPVLFPPAFMVLFRLLRALGILSLVPPIRAAQRRRARFESPQHAFRAYRRRAVFRYLSDEALRAYVDGILCPDGDGWRLRQSKDWELSIYRAGIWRDFDLWRRLPALQVPTLALRGAETDAFPLSAVRRMQRLSRQVEVITLPQATHLVPLERPQAVADALRAHFA